MLASSCVEGLRRGANTCTLLSMLGDMRETVRDLPLPLHAGTLRDLVLLRDTIDARLAELVAQFDHDGLWTLDGATSMVAWWRHETGRSRADANVLVRTAHDLRALR